MNESTVNKALTWDNLSSIEKGAAIEVIRAVNELRIRQGEQRDLAFYLREFKQILKEQIESEFKMTNQLESTPIV